MASEADVDLEAGRGTEDPAPLRLHVLGPVRVWRGSVELDVGPAQQAVLLAVLLARAGRPVSTDELAGAIWGDEPPASALNTIQKYVGALRRLLEPGLAARASGSLLQRRGDAYVLNAERNVLDLIEFRSLVDVARTAQAEQRNEQALDDLLRAVALWSGPAGTGLMKGSNSTPVFVALNAEFLDACSVAADLALSLGVPERALGSLRAAVAMDPYHEPLHARLITALGAAGQQAEALAVFRTVRRRLADELGLSPGEALVAAERAVLNPPATSTAGPVRRAGDPSGRIRDDRVVGRIEELSILWDAASSALEGGCSLALLEGEPGIGKSHLLEAVRMRAERHGMLVVRAQCSEGEGTPALLPWARIVSELVDVIAPAEQGSWRTGELRELIEPAAQTPTMSTVPDTGARFRLFDGIVALVEAASRRRPVLVVVDDIQWADIASLLMFEHLATRMPGSASILGALRDRAPAPRPELATMLAGVSRLPAHRRVRLEPMSAEEVGQLVQIELGSAITPSVASGLHHRTAGNPFFALELARLAAAKGDLSDLTANTGVPSTVLDVVRDRTARLQDSTRYMLQTAAVIGTEIDIRVLAQSSGVDEQTCLDRLQEIEEFGLLAPSSGNPRVVCFAHDIVRESVVQTTPRAILPRMHLDVADALDRAEARDAAVERIAYHLWSAGPLADAERTAETLLAAGKAASAKCAYEAAERHLEAAAQLARAACLPQIELIALMQLHSAAEANAGGHVMSRLDQIGRATELARDLGRDREAADLLFAQYAAHAQASQLVRAGRLARWLRNHGEASSDPVVRAIGSFAWGTHQRDVGQIGEAHRYLGRAVNLLPDDAPGSDGWQLVHELRRTFRLWLALTTVLHGDVPTAHSILREMEAANADPYAITWWSTFSVIAAAMAGDVEWADDAAERGLSIEPDRSFDFHGAYHRVGRCWAQAMSRNRSAAMAAGAAVIVASMEHPPRADRPTWYCLLAEMWLVVGEPDEAAQALEKGESCIAAGGQRWTEGLLLLLRSQLMRAQGAPSARVTAAAQRARKLSAARGAHLFQRRAERFLVELR